MRSNQNPSGSITRSVGERSVGASSAANAEQRSMVAKLSMPRMPVEWLDSGSWRLPSGKALAEFALQAGFLAPLLFRSDGFRKSGLKSATTGAAETGTSGVSKSTASGRGKPFGKGDGR
jgi:hypothetical protein